MKISFKKSLIVTGLVAAGFSAGNVGAATISAADGDRVIISCVAPSAGTAGSTVYSVDAVTNQTAAGATISLPTTVAYGQSCSGAINALTNPVSSSATSWVLDGSAPTNFVLSSTGYSATKYTVKYTTSTTPAAYGIVSCSAAPSAGAAAVYSIDFSGATNNNTNTSAAAVLSSLANSGTACSQAVSQGLLTLNTNGGATDVDAPANSFNLGTTYALTQYLVQ